MFRTTLQKRYLILLKGYMHSFQNGWLVLRAIAPPPILGEKVADFPAVFF